MTGLAHLIEFQMSLLLFVALAGYLLASRINQSAGGSSSGWRMSRSRSTA